MKTVYEILGIHKSRDKTTENVDNSADKGTSVLKGKFKIQKSEDEKRLPSDGRISPLMNQESSS